MGFLRRQGRARPPAVLEAGSTLLVARPRLPDPDAGRALCPQCKSQDLCQQRCTLVLQPSVTRHPEVLGLLPLPGGVGGREHQALDRGAALPSSGDTSHRRRSA